MTLLLPTGAIGHASSNLGVGTGGSPLHLRSLNGTGSAVPLSGLEGTVVVYDPVNGNLYIASPLNGTILVVNATTRLMIAPPIPVGTDPSFMAVDTENDCLYVVTAGVGLWSGVAVVNLSANKVVPSNILVGANTQSIAFDPRNGLIYVSNTLTNNVSVINGSTNKLNGPAIWIGSPGTLAFDSRTGDLYVGGGAYADQGGGVINTTTELAYANVTGAEGLWGLAYDPQTSNLYGDLETGQDVFVVNDTTRNFSATIRDRNSGPFSVAVEGDSGHVVIGQQVLDTATNSFPFPFLPITFQNGAYDPSTGWLFAGHSAFVSSGEGSIVAAHDTELVQVQFIETGLPTGTLWTVELGVDYWDLTASADYITSVGNHSYNRTIEMAVWNGTYSYTVTAAGGPGNPPPGSVQVDGPGSTASVIFGPFQYAVTVDETGLPPGTTWTVTVSGGPAGLGVGGTSSADSIALELGNGSYSAVATATGFGLAGGSVPLVVNGTSVNQTIVFFPAAHSHPPVPVPPVADLALGVAILGLAIGVVAIVLLMRIRPPPREPSKVRS